MSKKKITTAVQPDVVELIDDKCDTRAEWLREAVAEKLARDGERKRHLHVDDSIDVELSEFEAMFLARILWESSNEVNEQRKTLFRWWSRKLDAMRKTQDDGF